MATRIMNRLLPRLCLVALLLGGAVSTALAQEFQRVAAVVNEDIISMRDLEMRIRLVLLSSSLPDTVESRSRVAAQVLRRLVDEHLQLQEADHAHVNISSTDVTSGMANIERQNNMPKGGMDTLLKSKGIDPESMRQQIKAEIAWGRTVRREVMGDIKIGEEEIDARLQTLRENKGKPEYLAADIFLPIDNPAHKADVTALAERLVDQLKQGAPFSALARQFSQNGAASGGDLGWVSEGMLDDEMTTALTKLAPGQASPPVLTLDGIHIIMLRDKRIAGAGKSEPTFDIGVVHLTTLPSATQAELDNQLASYKDAVKGLASCDDYPKALKSVPSSEWSRPGKVKPSEIPRDVLALVDPLKSLQSSDALSMNGERRLYIMCGRFDAPQDGMPTRDEIKHKLEDEQMDVQARRLLRDIRRAAFIEFRV